MRLYDLRVDWATDIANLFTMSLLKGRQELEKESCSCLVLFSGILLPVIRIINLVECYIFPKYVHILAVYCISCRLAQDDGQAA